MSLFPLSRGAFLLGNAEGHKFAIDRHLGGAAVRRHNDAALGIAALAHSAIVTLDPTGSLVRGAECFNVRGASSVKFGAKGFPALALKLLGLGLGVAGRHTVALIGQGARPVVLVGITSGGSRKASKRVPHGHGNGSRITIGPEADVATLEMGSVLCIIRVKSFVPAPFVRAVGYIRPLTHVDVARTIDPLAAFTG